MSGGNNNNESLRPRCNSRLFPDANFRSRSRAPNAAKVCYGGPRTRTMVEQLFLLIQKIQICVWCAMSIPHSVLFMVARRSSPDFLLSATSMSIFPRLFSCATFNSCMMSDHWGPNYSTRLGTRLASVKRSECTVAQDWLLWELDLTVSQASS